MSSVIDIGPLSWVKSEIDSSLERARAGLKAVAGNPADTKGLKEAKAHLHQAYGAVQIVGLHGVSRFFEEAERLIAEMESGKVEATPETFDALDRAAQAIAKYLAELLDGIPDQPLRLYPLHKELATLRGAKDVSEADLYFPDLTLQPPPRDEHPVRLSAQDMDTYVRGQRTRYQRGFLKWLKDPNDQESLTDMLSAVDGIESTQLVPAQRAFWWVTGAFCKALSEGALDPEPGVKLLCSKIDQQMRRTAEAAPAIPERLMREVLYWVARADRFGQGPDERVHEAQLAYRLEGTLPTQPLTTDLSQRVPLAIEARDQINSAKQAWDRFALGTESALAEFAGHADGLKPKAGLLGSAELGGLVNEIAVVGAYLVTNPNRMNELIGMEVATGLLLVENAIENYANLTPEFETQARVMLARLRSAVFGKRDPDVTLSLPLIDEMTRRVHEKLAVGGALSEIQTNLHKIEQALDTYFRNPVQAAGLAALEPIIHQVEGALEMLAEADAGAAMAHCKVQIQGFSVSAVPPAQAEFEALAQTLSGLGFYIDALRQGKADFSASMRPVVVRVAAAQQAPEQAVEAVPDETVPDIRIPIDAPSADAQRLKGESDERIDEELLAIFLEEAVGVLETISSSLAASRAQPSNLGELTSIRRGFHTLKGSGRMVGLARLGDAAWALEQVMNLWQQEERSAGEKLFELVEFAHGFFADWVARLQTGEQQPDPQSVIAMADTLRRSEATYRKAPQSKAESARDETSLPPPAVEQAAAPQAETRSEAPEPETSPLVLQVEASVDAPAPAEDAAKKSADKAAEDNVQIGSLSISASLFAVFSNEARVHLETLERELSRIAAEHGSSVRDDLVRAAHTLAGICGTLQLKGMHDLGAALESALLRLVNRAAPVSSDELRLANDSVQTLRLMYAGVLERATPGSATSLIQSLAGIVGEPASLAEPDADQTSLPLAESSPSPSPVPSLPQVPTEQKVAAENEEPVERRERRLGDEIDAQLLPVFLEEANELVPRVGELLRTWRALPGDFDPARALQRTLHTLKGSARMAGVMGLGELTHNMETRVENAIALNLTPGQFFEDQESSYDRMLLLLERVRPTQAGTEMPLAGVAPASGDAQAALARDESRAQAVIREDARPHAMMRVRADALEKLVNEAGEVAIARSRIETEMRGLKSALVELTENVARLRRELREIEIAAESQLASRMQALQEREQQFDPLEFDRFTRFQELTRMMAESVNDVATVHQTLNKVSDDTDAALAAQARLNRELQQDLMRIRMVPIGSIAERLHRIVRQTSKELGKRANLDIRGSNVELDRSALERMTGPLEHLLRNAITHGLETPDARAGRNKPALGEIALEVRQEGNEVTLVLADDGGGLNLERIREKALEQGLLEPGETRSDQQIGELIFSAGLSTAAEVTELAGRGVGLDVVMTEVSGMGGRIEVASSVAQGTRFTIRLPLTTAVIQALLVRAAGRTYALPSVMVEQVQQLRQEPLARARQAGAIEWAARRYPLHHLARLLGEADRVSAPEPRRYTPILLVRSGVDAIAVEVDDMLGNQEVVVKNIGPQLARVRGIAGATVLGSGEIVMILNPVPLAARPLSAQGSTPGSRARIPEANTQPRVMVVDDSLTVRKITGRLLAREGYRVLTARDGVEALELLAESVPEVMLVDVEMPRMDGFDLTRNVRADARLKDVPIIMITSRTADKHKNYATELGVNVFLGKPYQEDALLGHIGGFVGRS